MTLRVLVESPFGPFEVEAADARFSTEMNPADADALVCDWLPTEALFLFDGPTAWYTAEPRTNPRIGVLSHPGQRSFLDRLRPEQLLHHAHLDTRYRVPHITHATREPSDYEGPREARAATVVSNYGGPLRNRGPGVLVRNAFATHSRVALYGRRSKWKHYRAHRWAIPRAPRGYEGEVGPPYRDKIDLLARYHAALCLENTTEPYYFSEKFVDAVRAGCVPIYHAHPTLRDGVLKGAAWVDPEDFDFDVDRTLDHALALDREAVGQVNRAWLESPLVEATSVAQVWGRIGEALSEA